jgi:hypothetical protein
MKYIFNLTLIFLLLSCTDNETNLSISSSNHIRNEIDSNTMYRTNQLHNSSIATDTTILNCILPATEIEFPFTSAALSKYKNPYQVTDCITGEIEDFYCGEEQLRYIPILNKDSLDIILVPMDCGDFNLFQLLVLKNNRLISNIQVDGKWYEIEKEKYYTQTSFIIDTNFKLKITIDEYQNDVLTGSSTQKYLIDTNGLIVKE